MSSRHIHFVDRHLVGRLHSRGMALSCKGSPASRETHEQVKSIAECERMGAGGEVVGNGVDSSENRGWKMTSKERANKKAAVSTLVASATATLASIQGRRGRLSSAGLQKAGAGAAQRSYEWAVFARPGRRRSKWSRSMPSGSRCQLPEGIGTHSR